MDIKKLEQDCETIFRLKLQKKEIDETISALEKKVKKALLSEGKKDSPAGRFLVHIKSVPPTFIVDTARLKEDGLFDKYSKTKAGYDSLMITENNDVHKDDRIVL